MSANVNTNAKNLIKWAIIFIVPIIVLMIPITESFTMQQKLFLSITIWTILMFAFELVDNYIPCIIMPFLFIIFGVADWSLAFAGWYKSIPWQVLGMFLFVNTLIRNGILKRLAYTCLLATNCTYRGVLWGMYLFGLVFNMVLPGGSCVAMATFAFAICSALELKQSNIAAGITLAGAMGYLMPGFFIYVPSNFGLLITVASSVDPSISMNFLKYFMHNAVYILLGFIMVVVVEKMFKPEHEINSKEFFRAEKKSLGKMDREQKLSCVGLFIIFFCVLSSGFIGFDSTYAFVLVPAILSFPIFNVVKREDIDAINFKFVFFIVTCMSIGFVAAGTGISKTVVSVILPHMQNMGSLGVITLTWVLGVVANFFLTPLAAMSAFGTSLTEIALSLNINPYALLYAFNHGLDQILFPYEYAIYLVYFSFGMIKMSSFIKFGAVKMLVSIIFLMVFAVPYWNLIGLL